MPRHVGGITPSWALQVGIQSLLRPRSPHWLIESLTVESRHTLKTFWVLYIYRRVGFLCFSSPFSLVRTPDVYSCLFYFQKLHQIFFWISRVFWDCFDVLVTRILFSMPPDIRGCGSVPGSWASGYCRHKHIATVLEYLRRPTSKISPIRLVAR